MVASVPEETSRTFSTGVRSTISSASSTSLRVGVPYDVPRVTASWTAASTSGWAWPSSSGPHEQIRSTYSLPSTSRSQAPRPEAMNLGVPPTALKALTGEFTPPGVTRWARRNQSAEASPRRVDEELTVSDTVAFSPTTRSPGQPPVTRSPCRLLNC